MTPRIQSFPVQGNVLEQSGPVLVISATYFDTSKRKRKERTNSRKRERERRGGEFDNSFVGRGVGWSRRWRVLAAGTRGKFPGSRRVESRGSWRE